MKIFDCKKAAEEILSNVIFLALFAMILGVGTIVLAITCSSCIGQAASMPADLEDQLILIPRFYNSEDCFAYKDRFGNVHTKTIDLNKFNQENMDICFPQSDVNYAFRLSLEIPELDVDIKPVYSSNWIGGITKKKVEENVLVLSEGTKYNGKLNIGIKDVK